jgi:hypothetical protein
MQDSIFYLSLYIVALGTGGMGHFFHIPQFATYTYNFITYIYFQSSIGIIHRY